MVTKCLRKGLRYRNRRNLLMSPQRSEVEIKRDAEESTSGKRKRAEGHVLPHKVITPRRSCKIIGRPTKTLESCSNGSLQGEDKAMFPLLEFRSDHSPPPIRRRLKLENANSPGENLETYKHESLPYMAMTGRNVSNESSFSPTKHVDKNNGSQCKVASNENENELRVVDSNIPPQDSVCSGSVSDTFPRTNQKQLHDVAGDVSDLMEKILGRQKSILESRRNTRFTRLAVSSSVASGKFKKNPRTVASNVHGLTAQEALRKNWNDQLILLRRLKPDFFNSEEARMSSTDPIEMGSTAYSKLPVSDNINADIYRVYKICYEPRMRDGFSRGSYAQFLVAVGQFARLCFVLRKVELEKLCEPGALSSQGTNLDVVKIFLNYFDIRASPSTVMGKAVHLKKFFQCAASFKASFSGDPKSCTTDVVLLYLS